MHAGLEDLYVFFSGSYKGQKVFGVWKCHERGREFPDAEPVKNQMGDCAQSIDSVWQSYVYF